MREPVCAIDDRTALSLIRAHYSYAATLRVLSRRIGSINQVFHIEADGTEIALRIRRHEEGFQYEKGVFKEVAVARLLKSRKGDQAGHDRALSEIWEQTRHCLSSEPIPFPAGAGILHYDFTNLAYSGPWAILEWVGDALNERFDTSHAHQLGATTASIHKLKFRHCYASLDCLGTGGVNPVEAWISEIVRRNSATGFTICEEGHLYRRLRAIENEAEGQPLAFVLCHNDLQCTNITMRDGELHILDWDNAQIAPRELDFVKMANWSRIGGDGYFVPDASIFAAFCKGYGVPEGAISQSPLFRLAEILWLSRVYEFASRAPNPGAAKKPFWTALRYADLLRERLS